MKNESVSKELVHLVAIPTGPERELISASRASIYVKIGSKLRPLSPEEQNVLVCSSIVSSERDRFFAEEDIKKTEQIIYDMAKTGGPELFSLILNRRTHLLMVLNAEWGEDSSLESHVQLIKYVRKYNGVTSVLGIDHLKSIASKLFMEADAGRRYLAPGARLEFSLSKKVSDPKSIYHESIHNPNDSYSFLMMRRALEIGWLEENLLSNPGVTSKGFNWVREMFSRSPKIVRDLKRKIKKIPLNLPDPNDDVNNYAIKFSAKEAQERGWSKIIENPEAFVSDLIGVSRQDFPEDLVVGLESRFKFVSGEINK